MKSVFYTWPKDKIDLEFHYRKTHKAFESILGKTAAQHGCCVGNVTPATIGLVWAPPRKFAGARGGESGWSRVVMAFREPSDRVLIHESGHMARHITDLLLAEGVGGRRRTPPRSHARGYAREQWREEIILYLQWSLYEFLCAWRESGFVYSQELPPIKVLDAVRDEYLLA